ncbi:hypothetical protein [Sulfurisphaera ohwakuensis]|uniref:Uncharacterized protein n=1 Tax=Sulfurisphaera ohwakuensis TaxID=69656 RepID=A0A650CDI4_SULOH|nr:hypothetical protein [Sulfurisphaera ohwakuensis]MBB5253199.1 hypothetical protein [Sulfurisphaera ohwakuensis]QGR15891.1 hypothetical protein D1869_00815 [Sulfurisphaera ohwakuensis]
MTKKEEKKKGKKVVHPMSEENAQLLNNIENLIKWKLSSFFTSNGYKNIDESVDNVLHNIFSEIERILKTQNSWDDLYNLSRIYYSYASTKLFVSSLARLIINRYLQKDDEAKDMLYSFIIASGKDYLRWVKLAGINKHNSNEIEKLISFLPFISFFLGNIDCSTSGDNIICKISTKPADKNLLEFVSQALRDVLLEINISVTKTQVSESGQFSILTLEVKD